MKPRKGCWTCTARKIHCDGSVPVCKNCIRSRKACQGYGVRLSWPKAGDKKRVMVGTDGPQKSQYLAENLEDLFFLHTSWRDLELHNHLSLRVQPHQVLPSSSPLWRSRELRTTHLELVRYFHASAYLSLNTFNVATAQIRNAIMSMAQDHDSLPGLALFHSLLAFAAIHRDGAYDQAIELKVVALNFLSASLKDGLSSLPKACQHVAASMLLGAFELLVPSEGSGEWLWHVQGAADMIQATHLKEQWHDSFTGQLLDWVYYHNSLSRFAVHHWRHQPPTVMMQTEMNEFKKLQYPALSKYRPIPPSPNPTHAILNLLSETCDTLLDPGDPGSLDEDYRARIQALEDRVENLSLTSHSAQATPEGIFAIKLFRMATQIYLRRATQSPWESPVELDVLVEEAFNGPVRNCTCEHFFPLLILACEAKSEEHRVSILKLIDRTGRDTRLRSVRGIRDAVQAIWAQQDLNEDTDLLLNYTGIMSTVISSNNTVPSFV